MFSHPYQNGTGSAWEIYAYRWGDCDSIQQYSLTTSVIGQGYTSPAGGIFSHGKQVSITATPAIGWLFSGWTGDTGSSANPVTLAMVSDRAITATFVEKKKVTVKFEVDMTGIDIKSGVYVTGEFPDHSGKIWQLNRMTFVGNNIYRYATQVSTGTLGAYYFLNDDQWGERESVPSACAVHWGSDRGFEIPVNSTGETFAFKWSSCDEIKPTSIPDISTALDDYALLVYPNPSGDDQLNISITGYCGNMEISLFSVFGRLIYSDNLKIIDNAQFSINVSGFGEGVYFLKTESGDINSHKYQKIIISR